ncbi:2-oxo-4-hydroxy-4-carboxy-5-ureidoimidazoline decarboxylase [Nocardia yamanashiensis]|uniref:2-oxo-4-hydroxy-4-carboxy-5-ureidoimidazoline decarboxylase n=1 Tax=Nocardia yamanashiensis TaxID=209247 RepID=UPI0008351D73|nr:2-oxo-4-hydroxy-4-carboxy-5-ureidoimidazoline decarboxylase [Nocardia yamanashiensis]
MVTLGEFNGMAGDRLRPALLECCDVPEWADALLDARPFPDFAELLATADRIAEKFTPGDVDRAIAAHPRIGERREGDDNGAAWSRQEQSGVAADVETAAALYSANRLYEKRFGRVFLICATGLTSAEILGAVLLRLGNDEPTEAAVVATELRKIALLRLGKVIHA